MQGSLFAREFLERGITATSQWQAIDEVQLGAFRDALQGLLEPFPVAATPNEAATEADLIFPVLELLGWGDYLPQQNTSSRGRADVPDALLFPHAQAKTRAAREPSDDRRYRHGLAIVESKRWQRALDRADRSEGADGATPSTQILRYLSLAEVASEQAIRWGILTNGRYWRLYWQGARSRAEQFLEIDLAVVAGHLPRAELSSAEADDPPHWLRLFVLLFGRPAFLPQPGDPEGRSFHLIALDEGRHWEALVSEELGEVVFEQVFPGLVHGCARHRSPGVLECRLPEHGPRRCPIPALSPVVLPLRGGSRSSASAR